MSNELSSTEMGQLLSCWQGVWRSIVSLSSGIQV